ncbi:hypothetical protein B0T17DRAFT_473129, partial [Bombardia bombarda]
ALDECGRNDLPKLLDLVVKFSKDPRSRVQWILTSRKLPKIEEKLRVDDQKHTISLELNEGSVTGAVENYIRAKVQELSKACECDKETEKAAGSFLTSNAHGTFLRVALVCQNLILRSVPRWEVVSLLQVEQVSPGLEDLYRQIVQQLEILPNFSLCRQILAANTTVYRPLSLQELTALVEMPSKQLSDNPKELKRIIELCGSFLSLREETVYFVHQSAKDFLLG